MNGEDAMDEVLRQSASDLLYGLFQSESLLECIGLYSTTGRLELSWCRSQFGHKALNSAIGPIIGKFGMSMIAHTHEEGDLGFLRTDEHLVWFEPLLNTHIVAFVLPIDSKAVFLTENLKNTTQSLRYLLEKRRRLLKQRETFKL
ncbi:MAG: hypothetical protein ACFFGZ_15195 [Candidatus Thorarchaeota archaeon]